MWLLFAGFSAIAFGLRGILYHWTSQKPINRNLMLLGVFSTGVILSLAAKENKPIKMPIKLCIVHSCWKMMLAAKDKMTPVLKTPSSIRLRFIGFCDVQ